MHRTSETLRYDRPDKSCLGGNTRQVRLPTGNVSGGGSRAHFLEQGSAGCQKLHPELHFCSQAVICFPPPLALLLRWDVVSIDKIRITGQLM